MAAPQRHMGGRHIYQRARHGRMVCCWLAPALCPSRNVLARLLLRHALQGLRVTVKEKSCPGGRVDVPPRHRAMSPLRGPTHARHKRLVYGELVVIKLGNNQPVVLSIAVGSRKG